VVRRPYMRGRVCLANGFCWLVVGAMAVALTLLQILIPLRSVNGGEYFWERHSEGVSVTTMGRWLGAVKYSDGMSGEFSVLYQYFPNWLTNRLSDIFGLPPFEMQFYHGAFLPAILLTSAFLVIRLMVRSDQIALIAAVLMTLSADPILVDPLYRLAAWDIDTTKGVLHVPATALALATTQGVAYVLFVPTLVGIYLAVVRGSVSFVVISGVLLGLLLQSSFLTFVAVVSAAGVGLTSWTLTKHFQTGMLRVARIKIAILVLVVVATVIYGRRQQVTNIHLVALWFVFFLMAIQDRRTFVSLAGIFLTSIITSLPLLLFMAEHWSALKQLDLPRNVATPVLTILIFFLPAWIATGTMLFSPVVREMPSEFSYLIGATVALFVFSQGELWGFQNHQYRFAITLIFPLSILLAIAALSQWKSALRYISVAMLLWLGISMLRTVAAIAGINENVYNAAGKFHYYVGLKGNTSYDALLHAFSSLSSEDKLFGSRRILLPPEPKDPAEVLMHNALLLGVSPLPGFLPDNRHIFDWAAYGDRMRIFCFLFPEYAFSEFDREHRICGSADGSRIFHRGRAIATIRDQVLKVNILRLLGIRLLADLDTSFAPLLKKKADLYGLRSRFSSDVGAIMEVPPTIEFPAITNGRWQDGVWSIVITAPEPGDYAVVIAGAWLDRWFADIRFADTVNQGGSLLTDSWIGVARLTGGRNILRLTACPGQTGRSHAVELTPIHFIAVVPTKEIDKYISIVEWPAAGDQASPCRQGVPFETGWRPW
jgi:hypothetical protein